VCTACSAGKYLTNAAGGTDTGSCTSVSADTCVLVGVRASGCFRRVYLCVQRMLTCEGTGVCLFVCLFVCLLVCIVFVRAVPERVVLG
jgi:hypothetical protein